MNAISRHIAPVGQSVNSEHFPQSKCIEANDKELKVFYDDIVM